MEQEIFEKLFNSKWNYSWRSNKNELYNHVICLFFEQGGFEGLYAYILQQKSRLEKDFERYYSSHLIDTLKVASENLKDIDFARYIQKNNLIANRNNFEILESNNLLMYYRDFSSNFRGAIKQVHKIANYTIIETNECFYAMPEFSRAYHQTLEQALLSLIFKGNYKDTLFTLLESVKD